MPFSDLFKTFNLDPDGFGYGEYARLFPTLSERSGEGRAASIFLACLAHIPTFGDQILRPLGRPVGPNSSVVALTEVKLPKDESCRPDGLIAVKTGRSYWTCLTEFKVGGDLNVDQVETYLKLARSSEIDAVLTISNEIVPRPNVSPVAVSRQLTRTVGLFHISWMQILSHLQLLVSEKRLVDEDHEKIVREFIRFLVHPSTGIRGFERMPEQWSEIVSACRNGITLNKAGGSERRIVEGWMQEERELAFILSAQTGSPAEVARNRLQRKNPETIFNSHLNDLVDECCLNCAIDVEKAAAPIKVKLDLRTRSIIAHIELRAPTDKTQARACVTWLSRQLTHDELDGLIAEADWPRKPRITSATFEEIRDNVYALIGEEKRGLPRRFRIILRRELQNRFNSRKTIIDSLEEQVRDFYRRVGQHVSAWVEPAPKSRSQSTAEEIVEQTTLGDGKP